MKINSDAAIERARRDFRRYGNNWFNVFAAARRDENGVLHLPREGSSIEAAAVLPAKDRRKTRLGD